METGQSEGKKGANAAGGTVLNLWTCFISAFWAKISLFLVYYGPTISPGTHV